MRSLTRLGQRRELTGTTYQLTDCLHHGHSAGCAVRAVVLPSQPAGPVHPLICVGDPRQGGSPLSFWLLVLVVTRAWWRWGRGPRVKVERPQRSKDERP